MADILYTYNDNVYVNLTNKCDCACRFCIRSHHDGVGDAETLWHKVDPTLEEVKAAIDAYDFTGKKIIPFATSGGSGMGKTNEKLAPSCKGAELLDGEMLNHFDKAKTEKWLKKLNLG